MHPRPFQPRFHHQLVGAFHRSTADRQALRPIGRILHLRCSLLQITDMFGQPLGLRMRLQERGDRRQQVGGPVLLQPFRLLRHPARRRLARGAPHRLGDRGQPLRRVREVQDPHRVRPVPVDEPLHPLRPIGHRRHGPRAFGPPPLRLDQRQPPKGVGVRQPGKVRERAGGGDPLSLFEHRGADLAQRQRLHLGPLPVEQRHKGAVRREKLFCRAGGSRGALPLQTGHLLLLPGRQDRARRLGLAAGRRLRDLGAGQGPQQGGRRVELPPTPQPHQVLVEARGQGAGEEPELFIEGEKAPRRRRGRCRSSA